MLNEQLVIGASVRIQIPSILCLNHPLSLKRYQGGYLPGGWIQRIKVTGVKSLLLSTVAALKKNGPRTLSTNSGYPRIAEAARHAHSLLCCQ